MSFMDEIGKLAGSFGGADPQQVASAAADHVQGMDSGALGDHLTQSLGGMNTATLSALGQQLLQTYTNHSGFDGDANTATQEAGVPQAAVAAGDPGAIGTLIAFAKNHSGVLQSAASSFLANHPSALSQLSPELMQGILGRLGGR